MNPTPGADTKSRPGSPLERLGAAWNAFLERRSLAILCFVLALNLALVGVTAHRTLRHFPNSGDEYAYLVSAMLFSEGKLSVPSPEPADAFSLFHVVNDGKYYGKYPPGWPAVLALGVLAGAPEWTNAAIGALTLVVLFLIGKENFPGKTASYALLASSGNPFFVFNSSSYFSHPSCLLFLSIAVWAFFRSKREPSTVGPYAAFGLAAGIAFLIRPFTALAFLLPLAGDSLFVGWTSPGWKSQMWRRVGVAGAAFGACFLLFLLYNALQTGNPWVQPFSKYDPGDGLAGRGLLGPELGVALSMGWDRLAELHRWLPLSVPLAVLGVLMHWNRGERNDWFILLSCAFSLQFAYLFYLRTQGNQYGPRYLYESWTVLLLLTGGALSRLPRLAPVAVLLIAYLNCSALRSETVYREEQVRQRMDVFDRSAELGPEPCLIFLKTGSGSMGVLDLTRNGIHFSGQRILFTHDLGSRNAEVLEHFPGRAAYFYFYDSGRQAGTLERAKIDSR